MAIFWQFLPSNVPMILYNIRYWYFFLSQGNQYTKYFAYPKIWRPKTLPAEVCIFGHFGQFLPTAVHPADCQFNSRGKWWIHVSSIVTYLHKNSFSLYWNSCKQHSDLSTHCYFELTVSKHCTHCEHSFLIDKCSCKMVNILFFDIFNSSDISCNFNLRLTKTSLWSSFVFSRTTGKFG